MTDWRRSARFAFIAFGFLLGASQAQAQTDEERDAIRDEEARALFESATLALEDGRHEDALKRFREALELSGRPTLYYNIGIAADRLRRNEEALEAFRMYLAGVPGASNRADVEARIRVLEETIARGESAEEEAPPDEGQERAPSPEEAAIAAAEAEATDAEAGLGDQGPGEKSDAVDDPITSRWWFWTIVGVVVVGGAGLGLGLGLSGGGTEAPLPGSDGAIHEALRRGAP